MHAANRHRSNQNTRGVHSTRRDTPRGKPNPKIAAARMRQAALHPKAPMSHVARGGTPIAPAPTPAIIVASTMLRRLSNEADITRAQARCAVPLPTIPSRRTPHTEPRANESPPATRMRSSRWRHREAALGEHRCKSISLPGAGEQNATISAVMVKANEIWPRDRPNLHSAD